MSPMLPKIIRCPNVLRFQLKRADLLKLVIRNGIVSFCTERQRSEESKSLNKNKDCHGARTSHLAITTCC